MVYPFPRPFPGPSILKSFTVLSLFSSGEQGAWYDPSDFSTMFQDSAGTTPVTAVEQPVGLLLDKSKGLALGSELVTNGDFSSNTWWSTGGGAAISGGALNFTAAVATSGAYRLGFATVGKYYELTFEIISISSGGIQITLGTSSGTNRTAAGVYTQRILCTGNTNLTLYSVGASTTASVDNVSIKEVQGNHASQSTAASRPVLSARVNLLTRTEEFDNATAWSRIGANPITANQTTAPNGTNTADLFTAQANGAYTSYIYQQNIALGATSCRLSIRAKKGNQKYIFIDLYSTTIDYVAVFDLDAGTYVGSAGLAAFDGTPTITSLGNGWYELVATKTVAATTYTVAVGTATGNNTIQATGDTIYIWGADLRVTNVGVNLPAYQRVAAATDYDTSGFPLYLKFDGTDDSLATGTIDPGSVDKAQVFMGLRKIGSGMLLESSANADNNNGSFYLYTGESGGAELGATLRGTQATKILGSSSALPVSRVETVLLDIAGASRATEIFLRANGSVVSGTGFLAADAGTGNFLSYPLYIGRRAGSSFPLNGNVYSMIVRFGANLSDAQIASTETYVNNLTKAY